MSDLVVSWLRTVVPTIWGLVIAWLIGKGLLPQELQEQAEAFAMVLIGVCIALYHLIVRMVEPWLPDWLTAILIGNPKAPTYIGPAERP
jgi:hypothetical protein